MTEAEPTPGSRYYQGVVTRLYRGSERGTVRSLATGRETPFDFRHVIMRGPLLAFTDLSEGMEVGFDVGWTSSGLCITVIRTGLGTSVAVPEDSPDRTGRSENPAAESHRQTGAEEQVAPDQLADRGGEDGDVE